MPAGLLDGKLLAAGMRENIKTAIGLDVRAGGRPPLLAFLLIGNDPSSRAYVAGKIKSCEAVGISHRLINLAGGVPLAEALQAIEELNRDPLVDGILPQLPLPGHLDPYTVFSAIEPVKDVDGLSPISQGRLLWARDAVVPCTPAGIVALLEENNITIRGKTAAVIGRSLLVGRTTGLLLDQRGATVTLIHTGTEDPDAICRHADILVAAAGVPELVDRTWIKPGAVIIDVGSHRQQDGSVIGDVKAQDADELASFRTPVPGGIGPMTVTMLLVNTYGAYAKRTNPST